MATAQENIEPYAAFCELPDSLKAGFDFKWSWNPEFKQWEDATGAPASWDVDPPAPGTAEHQDMIRYEQQEQPERATA